MVTVETRFKLSLRCHGVSIKVYDKDNNLVKIFPTIRGVGKFFNVSNRTISCYLDSGRSYNGYTFKDNYKK